MKRALPKSEIIKFVFINKLNIKLIINYMVQCLEFTTKNKMFNNILNTYLKRYFFN